DLARSTGFGPVNDPPFWPARLLHRGSRETSSSTAWCSLRHSPASVHWLKRRCAVWNGTPNEGGRSRHAHPLVSTYTIAVNTERAGNGAVPPPCGRGVNSGINGSASAHNSSGTNRNDNRSTTNEDHPRRPVDHHVRHALSLYPAIDSRFSLRRKRWFRRRLGR